MKESASSVNAELITVVVVAAFTSKQLMSLSHLLRRKLKTLCRVSLCDCISADEVYFLPCIIVIHLSRCFKFKVQSHATPYRRRRLKHSNNKNFNMEKLKQAWNKFVCGLLYSVWTGFRRRRDQVKECRQYQSLTVGSELFVSNKKFFPFCLAAILRAQIEA